MISPFELENIRLLLMVCDPDCNDSGSIWWRKLRVCLGMPSFGLQTVTFETIHERSSETSRKPGPTSGIFQKIPVRRKANNQNRICIDYLECSFSIIYTTKCGKSSRA